ncbi:hypothetical protein ILUMI_23681 [Ignelater luminosus]|uniref:CLIP domain-containing serine protease n=1 Tax=Ignelater luminosus TaxID=2038154 RepID=A0A8K0CC09_IGNLU|nr:hypothetical protein ILUMI_23681 [Ignelater luminosus]
MFLITFSLLFIFAQVRAEDCITPNNESAQCVSLFDCPIFLRAIQTQDKAVLEFYSNSTCGGTAANPKVCCGTSTTFANQDSKVFGGASKFSEYETTCGIQNPAVSEFPWFAKLRYQHPIRPFYICTGSLITDKYVITAGFCIVTIVPEAVRLGRYNAFDKTDCTEEECNEELQEYGIEAMILHPNYGEQYIYNATETLPTKRRTINDIGLIRLNATVHFSDYIRPICLPFTGNPKVADGDELIVLKSDQWDFNEKTKLVRQYLNRADCEYRVGTTHAGHICSLPAVESCQVHNLGGPVMVSRKDKGSTKWYLAAVEPAQFITCYKNETRVYMDMRYYVDWIGKNIKP